MPGDTGPIAMSEGASDWNLDLSHQAYAPDSQQGCGCSVCTGAAVVVDDGVAAQGYLNADARGDLIDGKPSYTIDRAAKQLTGFDPDSGQAYGGWGEVGQAYTVTYAYRANAPGQMPSDTEGFSRFNATQIQQTELALQAWSDVANITFVRAGSGVSGFQAYSDNAQILLGNYSSGESGAAAFANYPGRTATAGDVWVNTSIGYNDDPSFDNRGAHILVHELGHAIGLAHPGDYNAGANTVFSYAENAEYFEDSRQYTVMSYFSENNTGAAFRGGYAASPLLDDIAAAQVEYGANWTTRTGDTVYGFNSTAERAWYAAASASTKLIFAVWDAGGTDTFDFSGYAVSQLIDLREGNFSNVGGLTGNVAVAKGAVIENAIGGAGVDRIFGNGQANVLYGHEGADYLRGGDGDDSLVGGAGFDDLHGNLGNDTVVGGDTEDWVVGGQGSDVLFGDEGHDVVLGNLGNDTVEGGWGNDQVRGGQGDDSVSGGEGWDFLAGDRGDDTLAGGAGGDTFHVFSGAGLDLVVDFDALEGDRVNVLAGDVYQAYQSGEDTIIDLGAGDRMVLQNVQLDALPPTWIFS